MEIIFKETATDDKSLVKYSELLSMVFTKTKKYSFDFIKWQYKLNPCGEVIGFDAFFNDQLVAHYVTIPVLYDYKGKQYKGLLSLNTATHPDFQGKGLFTKLASRTYELAAQKGFDFVIGVANQNSSHGFINKLGFQLISPLDAFITLSKGRHRAERFKEFFQSHYTKEMLEWRYSNPSGVYFSSHNVVFSATDMPLVSACLSNKNHFHLKKQQTPFFKLLIGLNSKTHNSFRIRIPDALKPSPLNLIIKKLGHFDLPLNKHNIFFELVDFDAY